MKNVFEFIVSRAKEPSTWRGLTVLATTFGVALSPELANAIITAGASIFAIIDIVKKDNK